MLPILPPAPSRTDPTNFSAKADAWVDALADWTDAANALEQSLQLVATTGTSTSSLPIGTGSKGLTTQTGKAWAVGSWVYIASASSITNLMQGQVTAYNSATGNLVVNVTQSTGSGTYTNWVIALASPTTNSANLSGGTAGAIPYQSGVNTTAMINPGIAGQILISQGPTPTPPGWVDYNPISMRSYQISSQNLSGVGPHLNVGGASAVKVNFGYGITSGPTSVTCQSNGVVKIGAMLVISHNSGTVPTSVKIRALDNTSATQPEYSIVLTAGALDDTWIEFNLELLAGHTTGIWMQFTGADATTSSFVSLQGITYTHYKV